MVDATTQRAGHGAHPDNDSPGYGSTRLRAPARPAVALPPDLAPTPGPDFSHLRPDALEADLTRNAVAGGEPLGERIIVAGRILDARSRPIPHTLVELWQANAAGRYVHSADQHDAPLDPNFLGAGRCLSDAEGRYRFVTVKPGAYPWGNHANAWRPNHLHFSIYGRDFGERLITQMYFPGDPLLALDPIFMATPEAARDRLIAAFSLSVTEEGFALGYTFDMVLGGDAATPLER